MKDLNIYIPQWQSGAPSDAVAQGAEIVYHALHDKHSIDFEHIKVERKIAKDDPRNDQQPNEIRQAEALSSNYGTIHQLLQRTKPERTFCLGGDCGVELSMLSWWNSHSPNDFTVIWLDAHPDMNSVASSPSGRFDGMVLRHLLDGKDIKQQSKFPALKPGQVILAGTRCFDDAEVEYIHHRGVRIVSCEELETRGAKAILDLLRERGMRKCYIHIDTDVLDPRDFDCTTCMAPDGLGLKTLSRIVSELGSSEEVAVIGAALVEITGDVADKPSAQEEMCELFLRLCGVEVR